MYFAFLNYENMHIHIQNPKTKLDIATFVEFNANISRDVVDTHVVEFVRSFRYPPLLALVCS